MQFLKIKRTRFLLVSILIGIVALAGAFQMATYSDAQVSSFNAGVNAYNHGDMTQAVKFFAQSEEAYGQALHRNVVEAVLYPGPNREIAALAAFEMGKALLELKQDQACVEAWEISLQLNPGNGPSYSSLSATTANRMHEESLVVKYDLELLLVTHPQLTS